MFGLEFWPFIDGYGLISRILCQIFLRGVIYDGDDGSFSFCSVLGQYQFCLLIGAKACEMTKARVVRGSMFQYVEV